MTMTPMEMWFSLSSYAVAKLIPICYIVSIRECFNITDIRKSHFEDAFEGQRK